MQCNALAWQLRRSGAEQCISMATATHESLQKVRGTGVAVVGGIRRCEKGLRMGRGWELEE
eukprot:11955448-Alexandrium_andersonii.AAC.1